MHWALSPGRIAPPCACPVTRAPSTAPSANAPISNMQYEPEYAEMPPHKRNLHGGKPAACVPGLSRGCNLKAWPSSRHRTQPASSHLAQSVSQPVHSNSWQALLASSFIRPDETEPAKPKLCFVPGPITSTSHRLSVFLSPGISMERNLQQGGQPYRIKYRTRYITSSFTSKYFTCRTC